ncbi:gamma-glutamylcyclotransferase [Hyphomonas sp.]|uniref:gamma-glutamylcyclotransferase family protein n=1 Tax=Hyphomonas sp. TaxID=87 RepID=UPI00391C0CE1
MTREDVRPGDLFAFYGLLKYGAAGGPEHIPLAEAGEWLTPCLFRGRMYDIGGFPGVVAGGGLCHGVLWRIRDTSVVEAMDEYEDVTEDLETSLYVRRRIPLLDAGGSPTGAEGWIYIYNQATDGLPVIEDGNWSLERGRIRE